MGTGFLISSDGHVLTCYHVVAGATDIRVYYRAAPTYAIVQKLSPKHDLALLVIPDISGARYFSLSKDLDALRPLTEVRIVAYLRGIPDQTISGRLTQTGFLDSAALSDSRGNAIFKRSMNIIPITSTVYHGMSGSPVMVGDTVIGVYQGALHEGGALAARGKSRRVPVSCG